jgi:hypothetical protein
MLLTIVEEESTGKKKSKKSKSNKPPKGPKEAFQALLSKAK